LKRTHYVIISPGIGVIIDSRKKSGCCLCVCILLLNYEYLEKSCINQVSIFNVARKSNLASKYVAVKAK